jgi:hypothetical protein
LLNSVSSPETSLLNFMSREDSEVQKLTKK